MSEAVHLSVLRAKSEGASVLHNKSHITTQNLLSPSKFIKQQKKISNSQFMSYYGSRFLLITFILLIPVLQILSLNDNIHNDNKISKALIYIQKKLRGSEMIENPVISSISLPIIQEERITDIDTSIDLNNPPGPLLPSIPTLPHNPSLPSIPNQQIAPTPPLLPIIDEWTSVLDNRSGLFYWWNKRTGETTRVGVPRPQALSLSLLHTLTHITHIITQSKALPSLPQSNQLLSNRNNKQIRALIFTMDSIDSYVTSRSVPRSLDYIYIYIYIWIVYDVKRQILPLILSMIYS